MTNEWSFGLYNLYNRKNPYYLDVEDKTILNDMREKIGEEVYLSPVYLFPILPSISYTRTF